MFLSPFLITECRYIAQQRVCGYASLHPYRYRDIAYTQTLYEIDRGTLLYKLDLQQYYFSMNPNTELLQKETMQPSLLNIQIDSDRLSLLSVSKEHAEDIFREFDEEITTYMYPKPSESVEKLEEWIEDSLNRMENGSNLQLVVTDKQTGEFLGCAGLHETNTKNPELGIWIKKSGHGKKYGREAMEALKEWASRNLQYEYIKYPVAANNISSRKIAESLGGKQAAEYEETTLGGKTWQFIEYRIYPDEK